ncbi:MAG: nitroreductase family deazaflavin-dependent oxidoreductase [Candidatus Dormibacteraeota bacterium]|nr:nitroreductase family deazaflavin-dependent oxidoreductase [Candidatus Dormibacteraeota bacterium]
MSVAAEDPNQAVIREFRANQGRVGGGFEGAPLLLLHTRGAKSGAERVHPVMYLAHEGRTFVFASKAGADSHPGWYHNLLAHPEVEVEMGGTTRSARAVPVAGAERDRIYAKQVNRFPGFGEYQSKTARVIPVVELALGD